MAVEAVDTIGGQHMPLRDQVLVALRQRIVNGDYPPGERLTEDRLAADFGVSRNPVREALRVVQTEGFVVMVPRRGAFVALPDASTIADMFAVRERLETLAARLAAERAAEADVADLRALLAAAREATEQVDFSRVAELNSELHLRVIAIAGNGWLSSIATALYLHVHWVFRRVSRIVLRTRGSSISAWSMPSMPAILTKRRRQRSRMWTPPPPRHWKRLGKADGGRIGLNRPMLSFAACPRGGISVRSDHSTPDGTKPAVTTTSTEPCQEGGVPRRPPPTAGCEHEGEDEVLERRSRCGEQREGEPGIGCTAGDGVDAPGA